MAESANSLIDFFRSISPVPARTVRQGAPGPAAFWLALEKGKEIVDILGRQPDGISDRDLFSRLKLDDVEAFRSMMDLMQSQGVVRQADSNKFGDPIYVLGSLPTM